MTTADEPPRAGRPAPAHRRPRRWHIRVLVVVGVMLLAGVGAWQLYATVWTRHSTDTGRALVHQFLGNRSLSSPVTVPGSASGTTTLAACGAGKASSPGPVQGLLEIPKLGVVAPVETGVDDAQLDVAVGHLPNSVWPGKIGNSVLEAHDVSYFMSISDLAAGDQVDYVTPCTTYHFVVASHAVVRQGTPVYNTTTPSITLVTCWPTNALWFTPDRYLVTAAQMTSSATASGGHTYVAASPAPQVPVPAELAATGVTLATYALPMGTFTLAGTPDPAWAQTTSPLLVQGSAVKAFIAGVRALTASRLDWWQAIAPGVGPPAPLVGAKNPTYLTELDVTVTASGSQATGVTLTDTVSVSGGNAPGRYAVSVQTAVRGGSLVIVGWTMTPA